MLTLICCVVLMMTWFLFIFKCFGCCSYGDVILSCCTYGDVSLLCSYGDVNLLRSSYGDVT